MTRENLRFCKINPNGPGITKAHEEDAGYDLYSTEKILFEPYERKVINTNVKIIIENDKFGKIYDRSSMAKKGFKVSGGIIDSGYTGEIKCILTNLSNEILIVEEGYKIAQLIIHTFVNGEPLEIENGEYLEKTSHFVRGEKGFGSSGH